MNSIAKMNRTAALLKLIYLGQSRRREKRSHMSRNPTCPRTFFSHRQMPKEIIVDKEHIKGAADNAKGAIKDAAGKVMDDKQMQAEGKMDKAKGAAHEALGDAKDAVRKTQGS